MNRNQQLYLFCLLTVVKKEWLHQNIAFVKGPLFYHPRFSMDTCHHTFTILVTVAAGPSMRGWPAVAFRFVDTYMVYFATSNLGLLSWIRINLQHPQTLTNLLWEKVYGYCSSLQMDIHIWALKKFFCDVASFCVSVSPIFRWHTHGFGMHRLVMLDRINDWKGWAF